MTVPFGNLLVKNYAPGKWHFTYDPNSGQEKKDDKDRRQSRFPKYGGGWRVHLVDEKGDELAGISLRDHLPGFLEHADDTTAGRYWQDDVFAFLHHPTSIATNDSNTKGQEKLYAVIIPWWGIQSRLVIDLDLRVPLSPTEYNLDEIEKSYKKRIKQGMEDLVAIYTSGGQAERERFEAAEHYTSHGSILHHAGMTQMVELEGDLRLLKAKSSTDTDVFMKVFQKATAALHRFGFDEEGEFREAAANGDVSKVKELLSRGVDVNYGRRSENSVSNIGPARPTALHCAVKNSQIDVVKLLMATDGIDVNAKDDQDETPLFRATTMEMLEVLLEDPRVNLDVLGWDGTVLHSFCASPGAPVSWVERLLERGANPNKSHGRFGTCLHSACGAGRHELIPALVKGGCDINAKSFLSKTPLFVAVEAGFTEVVRSLLNYGGVDVNTCPKGEYRAPPEDPALCVATKAGHGDILKLLLQYPALDTASVKAALVIAVHEDDQSMVFLLLESPRSDTECVRAALVAASKKGMLQMCKFLLEHQKTDPHSCVGAALDAACHENHSEVVEFLIGTIDIEAWAGNGAALYNAAKESRMELLTVLLNNDCSVHHKDEDGRTALSFMIVQGCQEKIGILLEKGADPNSADKRGWTSLHLACEKGNVIIITMLLGSGANSNLKTNEGQTPLDVAQSSKQLDALHLLVLQLSNELQAS